MASIGGLISAMYDARNEVEGKCRCRCRCKWRSATRPRTREGIRDQSLRDQTYESDQGEQGEQGSSTLAREHGFELPQIATTLTLTTS